MKSAFLTEPKHIEIREIEQPVPKAYEVLVKIAYCGICTLEQRLYDGQRKIFYPIVPGHEASAVVVFVGSEVMTDVKVGDHVVLDLVNRCHACPACLSGFSNLCENRYKKGQRVLGAFSEYMAVRPEQLQVVPDDLPLDQASFAEPLSCCIRSLRRIEVSLGDTVLVSGAGTMGLLHVKAALAIGARVIVSDIVHARLEDARRIGADAVVDASDTNTFTTEVKRLTRNRGVEACIVTTPSLTAAETAFSVLAVGGRLNIYTSYSDKPVLPIDMNTIHRNEFVVTGTEGRSESDFYTAVRALANRKILVDDLISSVYPFEKIAEAVEAALAGKLYRVLVKMGD